MSDTVFVKGKMKFIAKTVEEAEPVVADLLSKIDPDWTNYRDGYTAVEYALMFDHIKLYVGESGVYQVVEFESKYDLDFFEVEEKGEIVEFQGIYYDGGTCWSELIDNYFNNKNKHNN